MGKATNCPSRNRRLLERNTAWTVNVMLRSNMALLRAAQEDTNLRLIYMSTEMADCAVIEITLYRKYFIAVPFQQQSY